MPSKSYIVHSTDATSAKKIVSQAIRRLLRLTGPCPLVSSNLQFMNDVHPFKMKLVLTLVQ